VVEADANTALAEMMEIQRYSVEDSLSLSLSLFFYAQPGQSGHNIPIIKPHVSTPPANTEQKQLNLGEICATQDTKIPGVLSLQLGSGRMQAKPRKDPFLFTGVSRWQTNHGVGSGTRRGHLQQGRSRLHVHQVGRYRYASGYEEAFIAYAAD
jgi:hypothetical protein